MSIDPKTGAVRRLLRRPDRHRLRLRAGAAAARLVDEALRAGHRPRAGHRRRRPGATAARRRRSRTARPPVRNSGGASCAACTLQEAMTRSLNTTFYGLAYEVGPENVARRMPARRPACPRRWQGGNLEGKHDAGQRRAGGTGSAIGIGEYEMRPIDQARRVRHVRQRRRRTATRTSSRKVDRHRGHQSCSSTPATPGEQVIPADVANDVTVRASRASPQYSDARRWTAAARWPARPARRASTGRTTPTPGWSATPRRSRPRSGWAPTRREPIVDADGRIIYGSGLPGRDLAAVHERRPRRARRRRTCPTSRSIQGDTGEGVPEPTGADGRRRPSLRAADRRRRPRRTPTPEPADDGRGRRPGRPGPGRQRPERPDRAGAVGRPTGTASGRPGPRRQRPGRPDAAARAAAAGRRTAPAATRPTPDG